MPGYDRTGPLGQGPRTGRGMGDCAGPSGYYGGAYDRGFGRGYGARGQGRGFKRGAYGGRGGGFRMGCRFLGETAASPQAFLANRAEYLESQLKLIKEELASYEQEEE